MIILRASAEIASEQGLFMGHTEVATQGQDLEVGDGDRLTSTTLADTFEAGVVDLDLYAVVL